MLSSQGLMWIGFNLFVLLMLALDLGVFHRKAHAVTMKEAGAWSVAWIALALLFNLGIYMGMGEEAGIAFLTGYLVEKSLSVDNIFVFLTIFAYFQIPQRFQHKILFWGIIGALVMRAGFIYAGVTLIQKFHWVIYMLGALLILSAIKMLIRHDQEIDLGKNPMIRFISKLIPVSTSLNEGHFFVREKGKWAATPIFLALVVVEVSDVIFAIDSIPAILAITSDPFIVYTSNVFAILGLRSLYFLLAGVMRSFVYLPYGLVVILAFIGTKMLLSDIYKIPLEWTLGVITGALLISIGASLFVKQPEEKDHTKSKHPS